MKFIVYVESADGARFCTVDAETPRGACLAAAAGGSDEWGAVATPLGGGPDWLVMSSDDVPAVGSR